MVRRPLVAALVMAAAVTFVPSVTAPASATDTLPWDRTTFATITGDSGGATFAMAVAPDGGTAYVSYTPDNQTTLLHGYHADGTFTDFPIRAVTGSSGFPEGFPSGMDTDANGNLFATIGVPIGGTTTDGNGSTTFAPMQIHRLVPGAAAAEDLGVSGMPARRGSGGFDASSNIEYGDGLIGVGSDGTVYFAHTAADVPNHPSGVLKIAPGSHTATLLPAPTGFEWNEVADVEADAAGNLYVVGLGFSGSHLYSGLFLLPAGSDSWQLLRSTQSVDVFYDHLAVTTDGTAFFYDATLGDFQRFAPGSTTPTVVGHLSPGNGNVLGMDTDAAGNLYTLRNDVISKYTPTTDRLPVATDSTRSVKGDQTSGLVLSASDPDGDALTYAVVDGPSHGELGGSEPDLTYTPTTGYRGPDAITYSVDDGRGGTATATVALTITDPATPASVSQPVDPGQTVATAPSPTATQPTTSAVTTPVAGDVTITEDPSIGDPAGYAIVGSQYLIEAPQASQDEPLSLVFQVDAASLPAGEDENSVTVFRDGDPIAACDDDSGSATPDPCVLSRTSSGGVVTITVLSSHASQWTLGVAKKATTTMVLPVAASTYGQPVTLKATVTQGGSTKPTGTVQFKDGTAVLGSAPVVNGTATLPGLVLAAATHQVTASYSGSATSSPSTSAPVSVKVAKAPVVVTTSSSSGLVSLLTFKVSYTSVVKSAITGLPVAGESVTTRVTGGSVNTGCTAVTNAQGVATCSAGPIQISIATPYTAVAAESTNYLAGTGNAVTKLF